MAIIIGCLSLSKTVQELKNFNYPQFLFSVLAILYFSNVVLRHMGYFKEEVCSKIYAQREYNLVFVRKLKSLQNIYTLRLIT